MLVNLPCLKKEEEKKDGVGGRGGERGSLRLSLVWLLATSWNVETGLCSFVSICRHFGEGFLLMAVIVVVASFSFIIVVIRFLSK